jgi:hypothetical protein
MVKKYLNAGKPNGEARWLNRPVLFLGKILRELEAMQQSNIVATHGPKALGRSLVSSSRSHGNASSRTAFGGHRMAFAGSHLQGSLALA